VHFDDLSVIQQEIIGLHYRSKLSDKDEVHQEDKFINPVLLQFFLISHLINLKYSIFIHCYYRIKVVSYEVNRMECFSRIRDKNLQVRIRVDEKFLVNTFSTSATPFTAGTLEISRSKIE